MLKELIEYVYDYDVVKIIDTDSIFVKLPDVFVSDDTDVLMGNIEKIENYVNSEMSVFTDLHNGNRNDFVNMRLKNEFFVAKMISYSKKRYIANSKNLKTGKSILEMRGVEGRRSAAQYVIDIAEKIQNFILDEKLEYFDLSGSVREIFFKIEKAMKNYDIAYLGMPVNPPQKSFKELKNIGNGVRGMIVYNHFFDNFFGTSYVKSFHVPIYISPQNIKNNNELYEKCKKVMKEFSEFDCIKIKKRRKNMTEEELICDFVKDLTIPELYLERNNVKVFLETYGIFIDIYDLFMKFAKKIHVLYKPFYDSFGFDYINEIKFLFNYIEKYYHGLKRN